MSESRGFEILADRAALTAAGSPYTYIVPVGRKSDMAFQWILHTNVGSATHAFYGTLSPNKYLRDDVENGVVDPTTDPRFKDITALMGFGTEPTASIGTDITSFHDNAFAQVAIVVTVTVDMDEYSLWVRGQERA